MPRIHFNVNGPQQWKAMCGVWWLAAMVSVVGGFVAPSHATRRVGPVAVHPASKFNPEEMERLWRAHSKALLRIGSAGIRGTHRNSLEELLDAHEYVVVKFNGMNDTRVAATAVDLQPGDATILLQKGPRVLYGRQKKK